MSSSTDLMIEPHSDHARALWGFALRLTGVRPVARRGRRPGDPAARLA